MIDRQSRDRLAQDLRRLLSGRMDNLAFDDLDGPMGITGSGDRAVWEIFHFVWRHYDDFHSHPLQLTEVQERAFKRCIIFLHSDLEFGWSRTSSTLPRLFRRAAALITGRGRKVEGIVSPGDREVWPFFCQEDYARALESPRLLSGPVEQCSPGNTAGQRA